MHTMSNADVYRITDRLDEAILDLIVERLEARGKHPRTQRLIDEYLEAMNIDAAGQVLDIGCGTGVIARRIVARPIFKGNVIGIDLSPYLTHAAARLAAAEGHGERIDFRRGDSLTLGIPDQSLDAVIAHTLLSHVEHPVLVLAEVRRVLKPDGVAVICDGDFAPITFEGSDPVKSKRDDETIIGAIMTQPRVMRQLPALLPATGLRSTRCFGHVIADVGRMDYWGPAVESFRKMLPKTGAMTPEYANAWAADLRMRSERDEFFCRQQLLQLSG